MLQRWAAADAGAGVTVRQLPNSRMVVSLVGSLQVATLAAFVYDMLPMVPDKMPEACLLVLCLVAALLLHYRQASGGEVRADDMCLWWYTENLQHCWGQSYAMRCPTCKKRRVLPCQMAANDLGFTA